MLLAALHGKLPSELSSMEDLVTSNVFGFLKYADRQRYLVLCRSEDTHEKGITTTKESPDLKLLLLHIGLPDENIQRARVLAAHLENVRFKQARYKKFENYMTRFAYVPHRIFKEPGPITYSDSYFSISGSYVEEDLFSIQDSEAIVKKLVEPMLEIWRKERP